MSERKASGSVCRLCKKYRGVILLSLLSVIVVCSYGFFLGYHAVFAWHNIRTALLAAVLLTLTGIALGADSWKLTACIESFIVFPIMLLFPFVCINGTSWNMDFDLMKPYFLLSTAITCLLALMQRWKKYSCLLRIAVEIITILMLWFISLSLLSYLGYFITYGAPFAAEDMRPVVQTYWQEALSYLSTQVGWEKVMLLVALQIIYIALGLRVIHDVRVFDDFNKKIFSRISCGLVVVIGVLFMANAISRVFPFREYIWAKDYIHSILIAEENHRKLVGNLKLTHTHSLLQTNPGSVILVIGESANRDHLKVFNESYPAETTPWLSEMSHQSGFYLFRNSYSNYTQTTPALEMALTAENQYNGRKIDNAISIFDAAKAAGYDTWWISNQNKTSDAMTTHGMIAKFSDHDLWTEHPMMDDKEILKLLARVPEEGSHFIVLHMAGSHLRYEQRIPQGYRRVETPDASETVINYDNSIYYTDQALKNIWQYGKDHLHLQIFCYVSDHGEDMKYTHGAGKFTYAMSRIPFFIYLSPSYAETNPAAAGNLRKHISSIFTNDLLFETMCGLIGAENDQYDRQYDLSSPDYSLPTEKALTKHGEYKIMDDPDLQ